MNYKVKNIKNEKHFREIRCGEIFFYHGGFYIKMYVNKAFSLTSNTISSFKDDNEMVELCEYELIITQ